MAVTNTFHCEHGDEHAKFAIGLKLKEFSVVTCDQNFKMVEDYNKVKQSGDAKHLTYKKVVLEGFSIFCDWVHINEAKNGGIDIT